MFLDLLLREMETKTALNARFPMSVWERPKCANTGGGRGVDGYNCNAGPVAMCCKITLYSDLAVLLLGICPTDRPTAAGDLNVRWDGSG